MKEPHTLKNYKQGKRRKTQKGLLEGGVPYQFDESASSLDIYEQVFNPVSIICSTNQFLFTTI